MSLYSKEKYEEIDASIARLMGTYPNISAQKMADMLKLGHHLVIKRKAKIDRANTEKIRRMTVEDDLAEIRVFLEAVLPVIRNIIFSKHSKDKDKINAVSALLKGKVTLLDKKFDAGIFERQIGKLKTDTSFGEAEQKMIAEALNYAINRDKPTKDTRQPQP